MMFMMSRVMTRLVILMSMRLNITVSMIIDRIVLMAMILSMTMGVFVRVRAYPAVGYPRPVSAVVIAPILALASPVASYPS